MRATNVRATTFLCGVLAALMLIVPATAAAERGMSLGIADLLLQDTDPAKQASWWKKAKSAGATRAKLHLFWSVVAPTKPKKPRDPDDPAYTWTRYDDAVSNAKQRHLKAILSVSSAPTWAEGEHRPGSAPAGTWKPDAKALGDFMYAAAKRYRGSVDEFQIWNEPNIEAYLTPQWKAKKPASSDLYKKMLNESYKAVHKANRGAKVITAGTSPYGERRGGSRMRPLYFWRQVFCLNSKNKKARCNGKAKFDVLAHNPINTSGNPAKPAINKDDISTADMRRLMKTLRKAEKAHTVAGGKHPLWAGELWYASNPPEPSGYSLATQARYIEQSIYLLWKAGVSRTIVYALRDRTGSPHYPWDSVGLYRMNGHPKPALKAFEFPFVADQKRGKKLFVWGMAPKQGKVKIELKARGAGKWKGVGSTKARGGRVFTKKIRAGGKGQLRATVGGRTSLPWDLGRG